jgi:transposase InsO family protein
LNPSLVLLLAYCEPLAPIKLIDWRKLVSPLICVGQFNHQNQLGKRCKPNSLSLTNVHFEKDRICSACQAGKQVGVHHPHKNIMTTDRPLELLHMDLFGPIAYISIGGSKYCLVIVDDYSRFTWVFFLQEKSQTQETLKGFLRRAQNEVGLRIKKIRSDNGMEFKNS